MSVDWQPADPTDRRVTVVVPTHDRLQRVTVAVRSVLASVDVDVTVVVVDDASTDGTAVAVERLGDRRVSVVRREVSGRAAVARNDGLALTTTPWIAFLDDDDLWAPDKLAAQLDALVGSAGAQWACTGAVDVDDRLRVLDVAHPPPSGDVLDDLLLGDRIPAGGSSVMAATALVRAVGGFRPEAGAAADWDLWLRLAERSPVVSVDRPLVAYRVAPGSESGDVGRMARSTAAVAALHEPLRRARGATYDAVAAERWLARVRLRNGDRVGAARAYAGLARSGRHARFLVPAVAALVAPRTADRAAVEVRRRRLDAAWTAEVAGWLTTLAGP